MVDGFFTVPRDRLGCPDLDMLWDDGHVALDDDHGDTENGVQDPEKPLVDRTVAICCFPPSTMGVTAFDPKDCISPDRSIGTRSDDWSMAGIFEIATQATSRQKLTKAFRLGYNNAGDWCEQEAKAPGGNMYRSSEQGSSGLS